MDRREYLAALGGVAGGLAGCVAPGTGGRDGSADVTPLRPSDGLAVPDDLPVPASALERGALRDAIPAIVDPAFGPDWTGVTVDVHDEFGKREATPRLADSDRVVGVERGGERRAYPLRVLAWHEVVNDALDGPLLVTYCPLCGSAIVAKRRVQARPTVFGVSGLL